MKWKLDNGRPICPQICEQLCQNIAIGKFKPNQRLFSVREGAMSAGVNPNTMQRAFEMLEHQGILYSVRGSGWFVAEDIGLAKKNLDNILSKKTAAYFLEMKNLGLDVESIKKYVKEWEE